jgi:hypothetical protein
MKNYFQSIAVVASLVFFITTAYAQNAIFPGTILEGSVLDKKNKQFSTSIRIEAIDTNTGNFSGDISWPSLNSIHRIEGRLAGNTITFKEVSHIKKGGAHLNCEYALVIDGSSVDGRWVEPNRDRGTVQLRIIK